MVIEVNKLGLMIGFIIIFYFLTADKVQAQKETITIPASTGYHKNATYQKLWGAHYREVWHKPISVTIVSLDTLFGELIPYELGGSRQTKSVKLRDKEGREYVLRSIDKTFGAALPEVTRGSFIESIANDQVTISNPYGALVIAPLAEAVGILHTNPQIVYVPKQPSLGEFNEKAGNTMYLLEKRPDENWETAPEFAHSKKIIGTDKLMEKLAKDEGSKVDQKLYVRSRLFDMLIGDWGRHEDQWRWAAVKENGETLYKPIPRDRDNAFTKFDGFLVSKIAPDHLQSFEKDLKNVPAFGFTARRLDAKFTTELTIDDWKAIATDMQTRLTDSVIIQAVRSMPVEVLPLLEEEYITKLKSRRDNLVKWAVVYNNSMVKSGRDTIGYNKSGFKPILFYNGDDRIHIGLSYSLIVHKWNKDPFWQKHKFAVKYSLNQKGFSFTYNSTYTKLIGDWNLNLYATYDLVRWLNFYGLGNESVMTTSNINYFRFRHKELYAEPSIEKFINGKRRIKIAPFIQYYMPIVDTERFVYKTPAYNTALSLKNKYFAGISAEYVYQHINDSILPTKGIAVIVSSMYTQPLNNSNKNGFVNIDVDAGLYVPISEVVGLSIKAGAATLLGGTPEFYQNNFIGGAKTLRGFQRERFNGTSAFYNQNELRWIKDVRSYLYNGKIGLFALYDVGRVWQKGEVSNTLHAGYGGGVIICPFNRISVAVSYAVSKEDKNIHLNLIQPF